MELIYPSYYNDFHCIASACPDSCCKEWDVFVDPLSAAQYRSLPGPLGDHLRSVLEDVEGDTVLRQTVDHRCPMWRQDGLCEIQATLGESALCCVCRQFPRLRHDYGDFVELGLELSCPEAARLILQTPSPTWIRETHPAGEAPDYDADAMALLKASRQQARAILHTPSLSAGDSLAALLLYGYRVQSALDGDPMPPFRIDAARQEVRVSAQAGSMEDIFNLYKNLEILTPEWKILLNAGPSPAPWNDMYKSLAVYFVDRYWLQSVSDFDLIGRLKFTVVSCLMINALPGDPVRIAQLYSKEIENDADNVSALLDAAYTSPALTDRRILGLLSDA
jgi:lysine-N-methylase